MSKITVLEGVVEKKTSGLYDAALTTNDGPLFLRDAQSADCANDNPQANSSGRPTEAETVDSQLNTPDQLLNRLSSLGPDVPHVIICEIELTRFSDAQRQILIPLLWDYICCHRDSNHRDTLTAVGAAIRKYVAIMPIEQMGQLAVLLESGHKTALPIELEIEIAKMIYRNFEVHPPVETDLYPELALRLWEMVQAYTNPRMLMRDKNSAVASLAIQALVAMRSEFAVKAINEAASSPYRWFSEIVSDSLDRLYEQWRDKSPEAAAWLAVIQKSVRISA